LKWVRFCFCRIGLTSRIQEVTIIKKSYESPCLTVHGTVEQVTQGTKVLGRLDGTYNQSSVAGVDPIAQS